MKKILIITISVLTLTSISVLANDRWLPFYSDSVLQVFIDKMSLEIDKNKKLIHFFVRQQFTEDFRQKNFKEYASEIPNDFREHWTLDCNYNRYKTNTKFIYKPDGSVEHSDDYTSAWINIKPNSNGEVLLEMCRLVK